MYLLNNYYNLSNSKKKILIIDDDLSLHNLLCRFFSYNGYATEIATNCAMARQSLKYFNQI